jgi:hypothetical protein
MHLLKLDYDVYPEDRQSSYQGGTAVPQVPKRSTRDDERSIRGQLRSKSLGHLTSDQLARSFSRANNTSKVESSFPPGIVLQTTGRVDRLTKSKLYVTLRRSDGKRMPVVLSKSIVEGTVPRQGEFIKYEIFDRNGTSDHRVFKIDPPPLSTESQKRISDFVDSLDFLEP